MTAFDNLESALSQRVPGITVRTEPADLAAYAIAHPRPFLCNLRVDLSQIGDVIPHVSNVEYVRWLDRAAE